MAEQRFSDALLLAQMPEEVASQFSEVIIPFTLKPHQIEGLQGGLYWDRFGLYDDPRTGKTITMQLLAIFFSRYGLKSCYLAPPILFEQFVEEFEKIKGHNLKVEFLEGDSSKKREKLQNWALNPKSAPDIVLTTPNLFSGPFGKTRKTAAMLNYEYFSRFSDCLFFDECHLGLQDEESHTFRAVEKYLKGSNKRLVLSSGTPLMTHLKAAYPQIRLKTPEAYRSRRHFDAAHVNYVQIGVRFTRPGGSTGERRVEIVDGYRDVETLSSVFYRQAHRISKFDAMNIGDPNLQVVPIRLSSRHQKLYKQILTDRLIEMDNELIDLRQESALRHFAQRIITSPELAGADVKDNAVLSGILALIDMIPGKAVVFANYNTSVKYLKEKLERFDPAIVYGGDDSTGETNRKQVAKFRNDPKCRIAVINPQAGGVGIKLGDVCSTAIFAEPVSSPAIFNQAASRILLEGQTEPAAVYILDVLGTFYSESVKKLLINEEEMQSVIKDKKSILSSLIPSS